jgi:ABC-type Fe3+/spermidine/putrescine transport system ATPase subunit
MSGTTALRVEGLRVAFGPVQVLTDVNLTVPERSFTAVLGASGSGKTTLLRTIAGFERPGSGSVELVNPTVSARAAFRRNGGTSATSPRKARCSRTSPLRETWASA